MPITYFKARFALRDIYFKNRLSAKLFNIKFDDSFTLSLMI